MLKSKRMALHMGKSLPAADNPLIFRYRHREDGGFYPIFIVYFF